EEIERKAASMSPSAMRSIQVRMGLPAGHPSSQKGRAQRMQRAASALASSQVYGRSTSSKLPRRSSGARRRMGMRRRRLGSTMPPSCLRRSLTST
ncbi:MAG: hypothetical protein AAB114_06145, partial [Chloroflexota bacterium]